MQNAALRTTTGCTQTYNTYIMKHTCSKSTNISPLYSVYFRFNQRWIFFSSWGGHIYLPKTVNEILNNIYIHIQFFSIILCDNTSNMYCTSTNNIHLTNWYTHRYRKWRNVIKILSIKHVWIETKKVVLISFTRWRTCIPSTPRDGPPIYNNGPWMDKRKQRTTLPVFSQRYTT